jgi:hypothetical protein
MLPPDSVSKVSLCTRLREERERRQIPLSSISANTKISISLFEALERGDVSRWPAGIYRRSFVRAYAKAIGLDPDAIAREFAEQFPDPGADPLPQAATTAPAAVAVAAVEPSSAPATTAPAASAVAAQPARRVWFPRSRPSAVKVKVADTAQPFSRGPLLGHMRERLIAVACDGGVVIAIALCMFVVFGHFWLPLGVAMIGYYLGGILLLGNTPGVCLWAPQPAGGAHYNRPPDDDDRASADRAAHSHWRIGVPAR